MSDYNNNEWETPSRARGERLSSRTSRVSETRGQRTQGNKGDGKKKGWRRFFNKKWILLVLFTSILVAVGGCSAIMMTTKTIGLEKMGEIEYSSIILDQKGNEVTKIGAVKREPVKLENIKSAKLIKDTFVAVEDRRFYDHNGVDYFGMGRAVVANIKEFGKAEGASTITMQVAGNVVMEDRSKTYSRKLQEVVTSWSLEREYSKDEILEAYLNYIFFGNNAMGIQMASKIYFDKDLTKDELEPHEAALLAGLPKAPSTYNPFSGEEEKQKLRRDTVLKVMAEEGVITEAEKKEQQNKEIKRDKKYLEKYLSNSEYDAYKEMVVREAIDRYGLDEKELSVGGYKITTYINPTAQKAMNQAMKDDSLYPADSVGVIDGAATMIDNKTGGLVAIAGGREYKPTFSLRSREPHQPGSSIKPLTVYSPAVDLKGYNEYFMINDDESWTYKGWNPNNYSKKSYGNVELMEVVARSLNVSTARLLVEEVGLENAVQYAGQFGIELAEKDKSSAAALALGGLTDGVSTIEMAQAYSSFPRQGKMTEAHTILKIEDTALGSGNTVKEPLKEVKESTVFQNPKQTAWYMTRMLKEVVENKTYGTGRGINIPNHDIAGKTGTSQESRDSWFAGYSKDYTMAATVYNVKGLEIVLDDKSYGAELFEYIMNKTLKGSSKLTKPEGVKDPTAPFQLKQVTDLAASYDPGNRVVNLNWTDQDEGSRVVYRIERKEEGSDWQELKQVTTGSHSDTNIEVPESGGILDDLFGNKQKVYTYRVIAIDTEADEESGKREAQPSNEASVKVVPGGDGDNGGEPEEPGPNLPLQPPSDLNVEYKERANLVKVRWNASPTPGVVYTVVRDNQQIATVEDTRYNDQLQPALAGRTVTYQVIAVNQQTGERAGTQQVQINIPGMGGDQ
ncbi:transglycosylase domain-containing protein [Mechercharimyces sp. CAU 1602]|uniref:transglycosylase domain-containing protein n=1 Tax=Mechercharimyces sp. CAU 1602 TaxID=2973933 RepID=UPI0021620748|nr:transglycosylase domain-containing protein [Mechercharimyces sp. CAU 1602]MCS1351986.1 transglycosylase domain-containing protein [Mechercharimyces sp. CAU 1602]